MNGFLIKGIGLATKKINKKGRVYFDYEYPSGTPVVIDSDFGNNNYVKKDVKVVAVFKDEDIWDYVKLDL